MISFIGYWDIKNPAILKNLNVTIKKGDFISLVGSVGSGKSSFLCVLLQEMPYYEGTLRLNGKIALVEQEPYVFSGTIRDNITFGKPFEEIFFYQIIEACCLKQDLDELPLREMTEVGEKGIYLSYKTT